MDSIVSLFFTVFQSPKVFIKATYLYFDINIRHISLTTCLLSASECQKANCNKENYLFHFVVNNY